MNGIRRTHSPGKIIFSGEHAVVHGAPALALAVRPGVHITAEPLDTPCWQFVLPDGSSHHRSLPDAEALAATLEERHQRYQTGQLPVQEIAPRPVDLLLAAASRTQPDHGWQITFTSQLPIGSGMGSSAAILLALFKALRPEWTHDRLFAEACVCENYVHGTSSGLDVAVSLQGGWIRMEAGHHAPVALPSPPPFQLIHTGRPDSTTGECVQQVAAAFPAGSRIWSDFREVTERIQQALADQQVDGLKQAIRENHQLLCRIGVVPAPLQEVIQQWEQAGGAAKLCGAGSIRGTTGGILLAINPSGAALPKGWQTYDFQPDHEGTQ